MCQPPETSDTDVLRSLNVPDARAVLATTSETSVAKRAKESVNARERGLLVRFIVGAGTLH